MRPSIRYLFWIFFGMTAVLSYLVLEPYLNYIILGAIMTYLFYPIYRRLLKYIPNKSVSATIVSIVMLIILLIPSSYIGHIAAQEATQLYVSYRTVVTQGFGVCSEEGIICQANAMLHRLTTDQNIGNMIGKSVEQLSATIISWATSFILALPNILLGIFIAFFVSYYLFKDGEAMLTRIKKNLPFKPRFQYAITKSLTDLIYAVLFGTVFIGLLQALFGAIGFYILGVPQPILWAIIMGLFAFFPLIGSSIVWGPVAIYLFVINRPIAAIIMALYGVIVISSFENILKPKLIGDKAQVHPLLVLLGAMGGIVIFGPLGFMIGPLILALFEAMVEVYEIENKIK